MIQVHFGRLNSIRLAAGGAPADEFEIMKTHVSLGIEIVAGNPWLEGAAQTIRHHHEHFDGTGYPDRLQGNEIPRIARIFTVVDVFDALTSERPYKRPMALSGAMAIIADNAGRHFDPEAVKAFQGIVAGLYEKAVRAGEAELRREMRKVLSRYFKTETAPEEAA